GGSLSLSYVTCEITGLFRRISFTCWWVFIREGHSRLGILQRQRKSTGLVGGNSLILDVFGGTKERRFARSVTKLLSKSGGGGFPPVPDFPIAAFPTSAALDRGQQTSTRGKGSLTPN